MTVSVITFGCRLNAAESEVMRARAHEAGLDDAILVNTCAVTGEAVRQARQAIRKARRNNPGKRIIVSGCAAQIEPEGFAAMDEVDLVLGNAEKLTAGAYRIDGAVSRGPGASDAHRPGFGLAAAKTRVNDIFSVRETASQMFGGFGDRVRAFVEVQNGCDHRCTFCVIPYGRGNSRSVPMGAVVQEVRRLVEGGVNEVVLTGVDLTAYGGDLPGRPRLGTLVRQILKHVPELPRLRLSSIDSIEADTELMCALAEEARLMPHLHLSLQAGDDMILKRMKRRHSRVDAIRFCEEVRKLRPDIALGADLIAGFPTETDEMFQNTLQLIEDCGLILLHVFPFSPRPGTAAARMPQVKREVVRHRAEILRRHGARALAERLAAEAGRVRNVLVETSGFGRTEHYLPVEIEGGAPGRIVAARIAGARPNTLLADTFAEAA
jgi:threonylcarbamoyladenosine tRNA methylthiotransferase MtaB